jgi:hypothetical protein
MSLFALVSIHFKKRIISKGLAALELTAASPLLFYVSFFNECLAQQRDSLAKKDYLYIFSQSSTSS